MTKTKIGILGASGYSGEELIRLLLRHPRVEISSFSSRQHSGKAVAEVFPRFRGQTDAKFVHPAEVSGEIVFLALPHGVAAEFAPALLERGAKVIDLSADFRLKNPATYRDFYQHEHPAAELLKESVYGLPELYRERIKHARLVACPGCYPTSIILAVLPVLRQARSILASSLSGVSGAGRKLAEEYLFTECNESARAYGIPTHRHLAELQQELGLPVSFAPHLVPLNRGILSTVFIDADVPEPLALYGQFYRNEPFVRVTESLPDTKHVERTNFCDISARFDRRSARLIAVSALDNLTKGAAGQAVQCMNLICGYEETLGLL